MQIVDVRSVVVGNPWKNWVFVIVETDAGLRGLGEATLGLSTRPVEGALAELKRFLIGADPLDIPAVWERMARGWYLPTDAVQLTAMSGVEIACWDLLGKELGAPLYRLLGGAARSRVPLYANGWYRGPREPEAFAARAREVVADGFKGLKLDPFGEARGQLKAQDEARALEIVAAVREAIGPHVELMIEAHDRFDVPTAIRLGRRLEPFRIAWFEAPVHSTDIEALVRVAGEVPVPVAAGERFATPAEFARLAASRTVLIWQPETLSIGGVWGVQQIAALGLAYGASLPPHNARGPVCTAVNAHLATWLPNLRLQEFFVEGAVPAAYEVVPGTPRADGGWLEPPAGPGLGVELDEAAAARYPYDPENFMRLFEPGWEQRLGGTGAGRGVGVGENRSRSPAGPG
jgi:galactonate dehydratase